MSAFFVLFGFVLVVLVGCKPQQRTTSLRTQSVQDTTSNTDTVTIVTEPILITSTGDTLDKLDDTIALAVRPVMLDSVTWSAVGDIMMGTNFPNAGYLPIDSGRFLWNHVRDDLSSTMITFGNLEGVILSEGGEQKECNNPKACYLFRTPDHLAFNFMESGFDLLSTANNHANDFGPTGRQNTQRVLDSLQIAHAGSIEQRFTIFRTKGLTIGFVAVAPNKGTFNIHNLADILDVVKHLDTVTNIVVVSFHAGAEGAKNQRITRETEFYFGENRGNVYEFAHTMIDNGADVLLGHGPHVVRALEVYKNRLIAYSLGNFLTYGRFNLEGPNGYSPILKFTTSPTGEFMSGFIKSYRQSYEFGPLPDASQRAANSIRELSANDFPENEIYIDQEGRILYLGR